MVEQAAELTAPLFERRRQRLSIELPFPLPRIEGDAERLTQVMVNLLANAQKFAPEGSTITIGGETEPERLRLWVEDEGSGLPPGSPDDLFARFVRIPGRFPGQTTAGAEPETQGEPEETGMGLGLWIVRSIVERHGGKVAAISRERGARFSFTLPIATGIPPGREGAAA
ncbi:MAG: ATP-binding protein [Acidobacteriota bacterium]